MVDNNLFLSTHNAQSLETKKVYLQNKTHSQRVTVLLSFFFIFQSKLQAPSGVESPSCKAMSEHRLENNPYPQISTSDSDMDLWHCACSMIKGASTKGELTLSDSPLPSRDFNLWHHEPISIPSLPAREVFLHLCPPAPSCSPETWVRELLPVPWPWGNPAWLLGIFWGPHLPLAGCARHKPQVSSKVSAVPLFPVCQADWSRVYFWSIKAIRGLKR